MVAYPVQVKKQQVGGGGGGLFSVQGPLFSSHILLHCTVWACLGSLDPHNPQQPHLLTGQWSEKAATLG